MAREYGLNSLQAIMCTGRETGESLYMFKSGDRFYIWNQMDGDVWEITKSRDLYEILELMHKSQLKSLKLKTIS